VESLSSLGAQEFRFAGIYGRPVERPAMVLLRNHELLASYKCVSRRNPLVIVKQRAIVHVLVFGGRIVVAVMCM